MLWICLCQERRKIFVSFVKCWHLYLWMLRGEFEGSEYDGTAGRDVNGKTVSSFMLLMAFVDADPLI
jgi:hypothetical protein